MNVKKLDHLPPGPWRWERGYLEEGEGYSVLYADHQEVIESCDGCAIVSDKVAPAIAALPALLAALKLWIDSTEGQSHMDIVVRNGRDFAQARRMALEAVAQAEGGKS